LALVPPLLVSAGISTLFLARRTFRVGGELYFVLYDDAMISMRYARNLVEGHGLVWNPGEVPVEGYTNFLWTLWMALLHLPGFPEPKMPLVVSVSGALILMLNLVAIRPVARRLAAEDSDVPVLAVWLTALCLPLVYWTLVGLEVGLVALLASLAMLLALRLVDRFRRRDLLLLAAVLATGVLVRTDQLVLCAVVLGFLALRLPRERRGSALLTLSLLVAATLAAHTVFRLAYYGEPLPNSYYLKVLGVAAGTRLTRGLVVLGVSGVGHLYLPLAFATVALARATWPVRRDLALPVAVFLGYAGYSALVGGDAWEWYPVPNRFLAAGLPGLLVASAVGISTVSRLAAEARRRVIGGLTLGFGLALVMGLAAAMLLRSSQVPAAVGGNVTLWTPTNARGWATALLPGLLLGLAATSAGTVGTRRTGSSLTRWRLVACTLALLVAVNAVAAVWLFPARSRGSRSAALTRLALVIRSATTPAASVAVVWAGIVPYWTRRPAVDLLGRSDRTIARMRPPTPEFWPGHNKWDYGHSVRALRPDLIVQLWNPTEADLALIIGSGYERLLPSLFVRTDSAAVDRRALEDAVCSLLPEGRLFVDFRPGDPLARTAPTPRWDWDRIGRERC
jgi:hypothetical protein